MTTHDAIRDMPTDTVTAIWIRHYVATVGLCMNEMAVAFNLDRGYV